MNHRRSQTSLRVAFPCDHTCPRVSQGTELLLCASKLHSLQLRQVPSFTPSFIHSTNSSQAAPEPGTCWADDHESAKEALSAADGEPSQHLSARKSLREQEDCEVTEQSHTGWRGEGRRKQTGSVTDVHPSRAPGQEGSPHCGFSVFVLRQKMRSTELTILTVVKGTKHRCLAARRSRLQRLLSAHQGIFQEGNFFP